MPIHDMKFKDGIFYAREEGRISKEDAKAWAQQVKFYAANSDTPIVALVDALDVDYISREARQVFARTSYLPNFKGASVAAKNLVTMQTSRVIGLMASQDHTYVFSTMDQAERFARKLLQSAAVTG